MHLTPPTTVKYHAPKAVEKGETWILNNIQEERDRRIDLFQAQWRERSRGVGTPI